MPNDLEHEFANLKAYLFQFLAANVCGVVAPWNIGLHFGYM